MDAVGRGAGIGLFSGWIGCRAGFFFFRGKGLGEVVAEWRDCRRGREIFYLEELLVRLLNVFFFMRFFNVNDLKCQEMMKIYTLFFVRVITIL